MEKSTDMVTNCLGRTFPKIIPGYGEAIPFMGVKQDPVELHKPKATMHYKKNVQSEDKLIGTLEEALLKCGIFDGMTISFHHHLRNGDIIADQFIGILQKHKIKNISVAPSSVHPSMKKIEQGMRDGTIRTCQTGTNGDVGYFISEGGLKEPIVIRSHGGRVRAIRSGRVAIDIAVIAASEADNKGNCNGVNGPSACGPLAYADIDALFAKYVIVVTDNIQPYPISYTSIAENYVDYVVVVPSIGDPNKIASTTTAITTAEPHVTIAKLCAELIEASGKLTDGCSFQAGAGGASLISVKYIGDIMRRKGIKASMVNGGVTELCVQLFKEGLIQKLTNCQAFDRPSIKSLAEDFNHQEVSIDRYANSCNKGAVVNSLAFGVLGATQVDTKFNCNVNTLNDGYMLHNTGGHQDVAEGCKFSIIVCPTYRGSNSCIVDDVVTVTTPGDAVDAVVTQDGIAINPKRQDLLENIKKYMEKTPNTQLVLKSIYELKEIGEKGAGRKFKLPEVTDKITCVIEWRDGTVIDVVREVVHKKSKYPSTRADIHIIDLKCENNNKKNEIEIELMENPIVSEAAQKKLIEEMFEFYGLKNKGLKLFYADFSAESWVIAARIEYAIKTRLTQYLSETKKTEAFLIIEKCISLEEKEKASDLERPRRSNHYIPGNDPYVVAKAGNLDADVCILDLEDAVAPAKKGSARILVRNALRQLNWHKTERSVRINQGDFGKEDIEEIVTNAYVECLVCPKIETAAQLLDICQHINKITKKIGRKKPVFVLPLIESAMGVENAFEIAKLSQHPDVHLVGLTMGLEDYSADIGIFDRSKDDCESLWAQQRVLNAAFSFHLQAYDSVYSDFNDSEGLKNIVLRKKQLGYVGKRTIHPSQIPVCNQYFLPNKTEIDKAKAIVKAMVNSKDQGVAALPSGKMIDRPVLLRAERLLNIAISYGLIDKQWLEKEGGKK